MSYSVVIPSNDTKRLGRCIRSVIDKHPDLDTTEIVVVNDGMSTWPRDFVVDEPLRVADYYHEDEPFVYARAVNIGISHADSKNDIVLLGDDVLVNTPGAFDLLAETSRRMNVAAVSPGIVGPVSNPHQREPPKIVRQTDMALAFVCVYLPREWIDRVGPLDERFDQYGCEDVDWCWRAGDLGGRLLVDGRATVWHNEPGMESAFRSQKDIAERGLRAMKILREKWPGRK